MQLQVELAHSLAEFRPKLFGIRLLLKSKPDVIRKAHHDHITMRQLPPPRSDTEIEHVVKIDIRQQRRGTAALRRSFFDSYSFPILQHARVQPFLDEPHDAPICDPMLDELHQPLVRDASKKPRMSTSSTQFTFLVNHPV